MLREGLHDLITFTVTQQAVVNKDASQLIANRFVQQCSNNRRINTARQTQQYFAGANLFANAGNGIRHYVAGRPVSGTTADLANEALEHSLTLQGVRDFRVKLHAIVTSLAVFHGSQRRICTGAGSDEAVGQ